MPIDRLPFNWFDLVVLAILVFGLQRGRKHGMSEELTPLLKWLAIVVGCALAYQPIGLTIGSSPAFNELSGYLMAYLGVGLVIAALFAILKKMAGEKWISSESFGRSEFYLGMISGAARYTCILIAALALLNARSYSSAEVRADVKYQNDVYGSTFFPKLYSVQDQVFQRSLLGPWIKQNLGFLLIKSTTPEKKELKPKEFNM